METVLVREKQGFLELIKIHAYMKYMLAQMISRFGDSVDSIAYSWMVYTLTGSELLMGSIFAFNYLPGLIFSLFTGVFVDRWSKKAVLIITYSGRGIFVTITAILFAVDHLQVWHLFMFTFMNSLLECFSRPAEMSLVPHLLPKEKLLAGNSFSTSVSRTAELIGITTAGALIALIGLAGTIAIDAVTFLLSAVIIAFIPNPEHDDKLDSAAQQSSGSDNTSKSVIGEMKEALAFLRKHSLLMTTALLAAYINFCLTPLNVLQPIYVRETLGSGAGGMSALGSGMLIGMIAGGIWMGNYGGKYKKSSLIITGSLLLGLGYMLMSVPSIMPLFRMEAATVCMFITGFAVILTSTPFSTYLMEATPKNMLGRIGALIAVMCTGAMPLGSFLSGLAAKYSSPPMLFMIMGLLVMVPVVLLFGKKNFRSI
ncbi:MFS transporter [Paenibacillus dakarensis]|uniref:MFS transporter n=1 Tax=Paenibacillus dakarensis TaxID=1527293 RepID=UPI0006D5AE63|nr:MFS transporter [Paenibacillus dakarensis]